MHRYSVPCKGQPVGESFTSSVWSLMEFHCPGSKGNPRGHNPLSWMKIQRTYVGRRYLVHQCFAVMSSGDLNLALKLVYFPSENHHPVWPGFGRSGAVGRNGWAVGRLGADAAPCLWAWGKVGRGQPQNSEVMWGPEQTQ